LKSHHLFIIVNQMPGNGEKETGFKPLPGLRMMVEAFYACGTDLSRAAAYSQPRISSNEYSWPSGPFDQMATAFPMAGGYGVFSMAQTLLPSVSRTT
jgi:hypothetical protein